MAGGLRPPAVRNPEIKMEVTCPAAPLQIEGTINGVPFYFRSRWTRWSIGVGGDPVIAPEWEREAEYQDGEPYAASWMPESEGKAIIERCAKEWAKEQAQRS